jgi:hypothetical protein
MVPTISWQGLWKADCFVYWIYWSSLWSEIFSVSCKRLRMISSFSYTPQILCPILMANHSASQEISQLLRDPMIC